MTDSAELWIVSCETITAVTTGVDASPLMTWGSIEGTPLHLETDVTPTPGPSFKIPKASRREELAIRLAEKASKVNRERKKAAAHAARWGTVRSLDIVLQKLHSWTLARCRHIFLSALSLLLCLFPQPCCVEAEAGCHSYHK